VSEACTAICAVSCRGFADEDDVRVVAQNRPAARAQKSAPPFRHLNLVHAPSYTQSGLNRDESSIVNSLSAV